MYTIRNMEEWGMIYTGYPAETRLKIEMSVRSWRKFCALSPDIKKRFVYEPGGAGYELKEEKGSTKDLKEDFHMTLNESNRLWRIVEEIKNEDALAFFFDARDVIDLISPMVLEFAQSVEEELSLPGLTSEVMRGQSGWFLRFLHYFGDRKAGEEIASPHVDKSGFTLHLYESARGLQYLDAGSREWREMLVPEALTVIIPGMQLQYKSKGHLKALCHRVVATEETAEVGRYSLVCFVPFVKTVSYDKDGHGRTQDLPPGFNYDMPPDEFATLFV